MAITRCPYCHAITDENDKYCNNCGTQLLFSEDEQVEEEIPGEKIIDAEVEEKDYTIDEPEGEKRPAAAKDLDSEIDEDLEEEIPEETEEMNLEELVDEEIAEEEAGSGKTEEVILVDEIQASAAKAKDGSASLDDTGTVDTKKPEPEALKEEDEEEELADELEEELEDKTAPEAPPAQEPVKEDGTKDYSSTAAPKETEEEPEVEYIADVPAPDEAATAAEAGLRPVTFDTRELEDLGETVDLSKENVDKFIDVMAEKKAPTPPAASEPAPERIPEPPTGTLPPWASTMKGAPVFPEDTGPVETRKIHGGEPPTPDTEEETEIFPRRRAPDSTIGLPEKVSQAPLPFETPVAEADEGEEESKEFGAEEEEEGEEEIAEAGQARHPAPEAVVLPAGQVRPAREPILPVRGADQARTARREIEAAEEGEERAPRPPFSFSVFIKSKAFDILFVGVFWVVALWLAAHSMGMTLFEILGSMSGSMLLLYAVLVFLYFFLFKFFLGETLGDRLFRPRE